MSSWLRLGLLLGGAVTLTALASLLATGSGASGSSGCGRCHLMIRYVQSSATGRDLDHAHQAAGVGCIDCHGDTSWTYRVGAALRYVAGRAPTELARRRFGDESCDRCHVGMAHLAAQTDLLARNPHLSHWPELRCGDCHVAHGRQVDFCGGCHENGGQRMTGDPAPPRVHNPWAEPGRQRPAFPRHRLSGN
jgi:hypothetical protein